MDQFKILMISIFNSEALGTRQLFSALKSKGYDPELLFFKVDSLLDRTYEKDQQAAFTDRMIRVSDDEIRLLVEYIKTSKPDIISFSLVSPYFNLYKRLYPFIRQAGDFKIVIGGWQATLNPEETIQYADIVCVGEGDAVFPELVDAVRDGLSINDIQNLWINSNGKVIRNPVRPLQKDLDQLPDVVFDNSSTCYIENNEIVNVDPYSKNIRYGVMAGRGCPFHCTYCSNSYMAETVYPSEWTKARYRSPHNVIRELVEVKRTFPDIQRVNFYDEVFHPKMDWINTFFPAYKELIGLPFYVMFYPGTCKEDTLAILKDAGLSGVWLGVQSGSERVRSEIFKRRYSNKTILDQAALFKKYGVSVRYDFILDNPFESFEESLESIYLLLDFPEPFSLNLFSLKYFPKTTITEMALTAGHITNDMLDDQKACDQHNYQIALGKDNSQRAFINMLAMYVALLANKGWVGLNKANILYLIAKYQQDQDIQPIKELTTPLFSDVLA